MAIVGYEGLVIVTIIIIIFLWGPKKLPEMVRSIAQAKREFEKSTKELSGAADITPRTAENVPQDPLIVAAKSLGMATDGKTKEDIAKEIAERTKQ